MRRVCNSKVCFLSAGGSIVSVSDDTDIDEDEGTGFIMGGKHDLILAALDGRWCW